MLILQQMQNFYIVFNYTVVVYIEDTVCKNVTIFEACFISN